MNPVGRRLIALAFAVMACQVVSTVATPMLLFARAGEPTGSDEITCTCTHGLNAECPMHKHKRSASPSPGTSWCTGGQDSQASLLTTLLAFAGPVVERHQEVRPQGISEPLIPLLVCSLDLDRPPVSPPPRS